MGLKKILVCEDDQSILDILDLVLVHSGFITALSNRCTGIKELVAVEKPDPVILDVWMPITTTGPGRLLIHDNKVRWKRFAVHHKILPSGFAWKMVNELLFSGKGRISGSCRLLPTIKIYPLNKA